MSTALLIDIRHGGHTVTGIAARRGIDAVLVVRAAGSPTFRGNPGRPPITTHILRRRGGVWIEIERAVHHDDESHAKWWRLAIAPPPKSGATP